MTLKLFSIKAELVAKQAKESGVKDKTNNKDNNQENKERECIVFPSYSKLLRSILNDSPLSSIPCLTLNTYTIFGGIDLADPLFHGVKVPDDKPKEDKLKEEVAKDTQASTKDETILEEATRILGGDRQTDYGDPVRNFINIAKEVNRWAGTELSPLDCVNVHIATKTCREQFRHKRDNQVDLVAYQEIKRRIIDWCATHDWKTE